MKTQILTTVAACILELVMLGQPDGGILGPRVQRSGPSSNEKALITESTAINSIYKRIDDYNRQQTDLKALKEGIDNDINTFFEGTVQGMKEKAKTMTEADWNVEITMLEALSMKYRHDFENNKEIIKQIMFEVAHNSVIGNEVIDAMDEFNHLMKEGDQMRAEAYLADEMAAKAGMLSNAVEKEQMAVRGQRKVIGLLETKEDALSFNK